MSAIKKGLRRSGATGKPRMTEPRSTFTDRLKSLPFNEASKTSVRMTTRDTGRSISPALKARTVDYSSRTRFSKPAIGAERSFRSDRNRATRMNETLFPTSSITQQSSALRLHMSGSQEVDDQYGNSSVYRKVAQYDPAEAKKGRRQERVAQREARNPSLSRDYVKIQLSTAASEFIYGRSSVYAALKLGNRRIYKLYIARMAGEEGTGTEDLAKYALNRGSQIIWVTNSQSQAEMDKVAKGRPHNGVILEASPLPRLPVRGLRRARKGQSFEVELQRQSTEEEVVNGTNPTIQNEAPFPRYPFLIMLDEIVDQGNLGGILRSARFLGADAVVLSSHMAALNAVALKAASGAAEGIKLLSVHNTTGFLQASKENGWKVYAAIAPPVGRTSQGAKHIELSQLGQPLQDAPCILLLGGEGEGLRRDLILKSDQTLSITGSQSFHSDLDSLNVSVAAGILMEAFLRKPKRKPLNDHNAEVSETLNSPNLLF